MHTPLLTKLAAAQFGVVSTAELVAAGISRATITRWVDDGLLHRIHPGVYAVGHATLTREARWMAAQLWAGDDGCLGYWTAAMLHQLTMWIDHRPHVIVPRSRSARNPRLRVHRSVVSPQDITHIGPFRVTTWARTITDLADEATDYQLKTVLDESIKLFLFDKPVLDEAAANATGRHGLKRLKAAAHQLQDVPITYRSNTERRIADELIALGLPAAEVNATIRKPDGTYVELDLFWRLQRVNAEIDGPQHDLPFQKAHDAERDAWLDTQHIIVRRFPVRGLRAAAIAATVGPLLRC